MPVITVEWLEGRTQQQKAQVAAALTKALAEIAQVPGDQVWIVFRDVPRSNWAMNGRLLGPQAGSAGHGNPQSPTSSA